MTEPADPKGGRRRGLVIASACAAVILVGGAGAAFADRSYGDRQNAGRAAAQASAGSGSAALNAEPEESATVSASPVPASQAPPSASPRSTSMAGSPTSTESTAPATVPAKPAPQPSTCHPNGYAELTKVPGYDGVTAAEVFLTDHGGNTLCPGERVRVFWASYQLDADGVGHLIGSQEYWLDATHTTVAIHVSVTLDHCTNPWFIARGNDVIPQTLSPGGEPFAHWMLWSKGRAEPDCS